MSLQISQLASVGGVDGRDSVRRMMRKLLASDFQKKFNRTGVNNRLKFSEYLEPLIKCEFSYRFVFMLTKCILSSKCIRLLSIPHRKTGLGFLISRFFIFVSAAIMKVTRFEITEALIEDTVRRTLKDAGDRDGGRKRRCSEQSKRGSDLDQPAVN